MPPTSISSARGTPSPLIYPHTSDANPLVVLVTTHQSGTHSGVVFGTTSASLIAFVVPTASNGVASDPISCWLIGSPTSTTANIQVTTVGADSDGISSAAINLSGWPTIVGNYRFFSQGGRQDLTHPNITIVSSPVAEVLDWITYNDIHQVTTPAAGQVLLYSQDGGSGALAQRSSGSIKAGAVSVNMAWNMTTGQDYWSHGVLTFIVGALASGVYELPEQDAAQFTHDVNWINTALGTSVSMAIPNPNAFTYLIGDE